MDYMEHANHAAMNHSAHMGHGGHEMVINTTHIHNMKDAMDHSLHLREGHDHHGSHGGSHGGSHSGHAMQHNMSMTFHGGYMETILFSWWNCHGVGEFIGSFLAIFIMALLYEGLKYYRKHLLWKTYAGLQYCAVSNSHKGAANVCSPDDPPVIQPVPHVLERNVPRMLSAAHAWQTGLHGVQVLVSYVLMLVFMTYNVWLCAAVVMGSATGYFLFGWRESVVVDFTEHCH